MVAVGLELHGQVQELLALGVDVQLAVHDPAAVGAVLHGVPDVAVTGDDGVALVGQLRGGLIELLPAGADLRGDLVGVIGAEDVLGDGAAVDESAARCLEAEAHQLAVGVGADVHGVLGDAGLFQFGIHVDAQVLIGQGVLAGVALGVFQHESRLGAVDVGRFGAAGSQRLIQSRLIGAVGGGDDGGFDLIAEIGMLLQELLDHGGDLVGEGPQVDGFRSSGGGVGVGAAASCGHGG